MAETGVSFVVPVYNKAAHLDGVLRQIRCQAGAFEKQYVFVDDGSTDESMDIVRRITADWENVVTVSQENTGSAAATNRGIELADMPFIKFVDADDLISDHTTETLLNALQDSPACLAYGRQRKFSALSEIDLSGPRDVPKMSLHEAPLHMALKNSLFNPTQCLARTDAVKKVGGCDVRIVHSQEYSLTLRLAQHWPLLEIDAVVAYIPEDAPGRLSTNEGRQLQRVTRSLAYFLRDYPNLSAATKRYACRRAAGRAWKFAKRKHNATPLTSPWFWRYVSSLLPFSACDADFIDRCCQAFEPNDQDTSGTATA